MQDEKLHDRVITLSQQMTAVMLAIDNQTDVLGIINAQLNEVLEWMNRPASTGLQDALKDIAAAMGAINANLKDLPQRVLLAKASK
jgi:hypothetical protein